MNLHLYNAEMIRRILKLAYKCNSSKRKYEKIKVFGEEAALSLQRIVEGKFEGLLTPEMVKEVETAIFDYNGVKQRYESDYIGIPEWSYVCSAPIKNGKLLEQTNLSTHASWMLFIKELKGAHASKSKPFEKIWFDFMGRLILNGYKSNVTLIHNYLFLMHHFSTLDPEVEQSYIKGAAEALLDGLELTDYMDVTVMEQMISHLWNNPLFSKLFKSYPVNDAEDLELKNACEFSNKMLVKSLWNIDVVNNFGLPLENDSNPTNPGWKGISADTLASLIVKAESGEISAPSIAVNAQPHQSAPDELYDLVGRLSGINLESSWLPEELDVGENAFSLIDDIASARRARSLTKKLSSEDSGSDHLTQSLSAMSSSSTDSTYLPLRDSTAIAHSEPQIAERAELTRTLSNSQ